MFRLFQVEALGEKQAMQRFHVLHVGLSGCLLLAGCAQQATPSKPAATAQAKGQAAPQLMAADDLQREIDEVIDFTAERNLDATNNAAWQVVHGILAYGDDLKMTDRNGKVVPALQYLSDGGELRGWKLQPGDHGLEAIVEAGSSTGQGHEDQWLGYLSLLGLPLDHPLKVGSQTFQVRDLLTQAQWDVYDGMEATWTLMAVSSYLPPDATWKAKDGTDWSVERIVDMETKQDLAESACGGSHRMVGIATAVNRHNEQQGELKGAWVAADAKIKDCLRRAREFQQPNGALSAAYFERPSTSGDLAQQIQTTGHVLEFVVVSCSDEELDDPWIQRAVQYLCKSFRLTKDADVECGWLYHATRGLKIYRDRRFGPRETPVATPVVAQEGVEGEAQRR